MGWYRVFSSRADHDPINGAFHIYYPDFIFPAPMRLLTPEIAWHETLPVYSCDLQPMAVGSTASSVTRSPLSELKPESFVAAAGRPITLDSPVEWTRLATGGGDNMVRMWRVRLTWTASCGDLVAGTSVPGKKVISGDNPHPDLTDNLTHLATLKRHEKPVNVVRWSPLGWLVLLTCLSMFSLGRYPRVIHVNFRVFSSKAYCK